MADIQAMFAEFETIHIPDPEVFSPLLNHFQNWGSQHQEYLQQLDAGHSNLKAFWQGNGAETYSELHAHMQKVNNAHVEHMQHTVTSFQNIKDQVSHAQDLYDTAKIAFEVALTAAVVGIVAVVFTGSVSLYVNSSCVIE